MTQSTKTKRRLIIDFSDEESMTTWLRDARRVGAFPLDTTIFKMDAIDRDKITQGAWFIVRRKGDRAQGEVETGALSPEAARRLQAELDTDWIKDPP